MVSDLLWEAEFVKVHAILSLSKKSLRVNGGHEFYLRAHVIHNKLCSQHNILAISPTLTLFFVDTPFVIEQAVLLRFPNVFSACSLVFSVVSTRKG
jgi:hypothetical protein